jgi:hypothetical protein
MDRRQLCVANLKYKKPSEDGAKQSKNLLRYLTYREGRDEAARQVAGRSRWVDQGMGGSVAEIAQRCDDLKSEHVLTFSLVINPSPDLIAMVAPTEREPFVRELTEGVVDHFFEARGIDTGIEASYVLHHRLTDDPESPGQHNPHTHVVLPGTVYDEEHGQRVPLFFSQNRKVDHIDLLHRVTEQQMEALLERYVGRDWEQRYDTLAAVREQERQITEEKAHGMTLDDEGQGWPVWCGTRRTDERRTAVGVYRSFPAAREDDPDAVQIAFRPLLSGLSHDEAAALARAFARAMNGYLDTLSSYIEAISAMSADERAALVAQIEAEEHQRRENSFDLHF